MFLFENQKNHKKIKVLSKMTCYEIIEFLKTLIAKLLKSSTQFSPNFKKLKSSTSNSGRCWSQNRLKLIKNSPKMPKLSS